MQETYAIAGNIVGRKDGNGGNGLGYQPDVSYTLTETDVHCVFAQQGHVDYSESLVASTQTARQHKDATDLVCDVTVFGQSQFGNYKEGSVGASYREENQKRRRTASRFVKKNGGTRCGVYLCVGTIN